MNSNIKKFDSKEAFDAYRATDGWAYPSVNYITNNEESSIHYNNEFIMEWEDSDTVKTPAFYGDISYDWFKNWVDTCAKPCEIKKDGTDFAYIKRVSDSSSEVDDWTLRHGSSAGSSHYSASGTSEYLQMVELQNVNVGLFKNTKKGTKQVRFNFDKGCPAGFHKWFPNSTNGTKLFGRYDITPTTSTTDAGTSGIECCVGGTQGTLNTTTNVHEKGNWTAQRMYAGINYLNSQLDSSLQGKYQFMEETYWEHLVMSYIFCAYFKTFNSQSIYGGWKSDYGTHAGNLLSGETDGRKLHYSEYPNTANSAYKFLHLENPLHGKQWIWGAGWRGEGTKYYMTFDDKVANEAQDLNISHADITGTIPSMSSTWIFDIDLYGVPSNIVGGSSSQGFFDAGWSNTTANSRIAYLGGSSNNGDYDGVFARSFNLVASDGYWSLRGRLTMNR